MQNFDLGPSLVDEVMKAFGNSSKAEKSPTRNRNVEENSFLATTPCQPKDFRTSLDSTVVHTSSNVGDGAYQETIVSTKLSDCDVPTRVIKAKEYCSQNSAESMKSNDVPVVSSESSPKVLSASAASKCNKDVDTSFDIWQQQQMPQKKAEQMPASIHRKNSDDAASLAAGSRYPAIIGNCSLSPRPVYPRESSVRGLSAMNSSPSSTLSSSSEERIPAGMSSRVAASLVAASSSSLPARSSLVQDSWSKLPPPYGTKVPSADSSDSESSNFIQRLKGKASLSRLSGFRMSVDSRTTKSGLPTQNLNVNVHFFDRLREQELQNSKDNIAKLAEPVESDIQKRSSSSTDTSKHLPFLRLDISRSRPVSESLISEHREVDSSSSGTETVSGGTDGVSPVFSSHSEVARLSSRSTESHDSFSHDSEHSSTTQPSDEGVYSDDSVAASADELRPGSDQITPTSRSMAAATTAITLGIADKQDVFWTCSVNFRDFVDFEKNWSRGNQAQVAERYNTQTDMCYEDRLECELNGYIDMYRYFVLIFSVFNFI